LSKRSACSSLPGRFLPHAGGRNDVVGEGGKMRAWEEVRWQADGLDKV
jgi:hypothetical protein